MSGAAQALVFVVSGSALVLIIWLVRLGKLKERFALLWLGIGVGMVGMALARPLLDRLTEALGIASGTTTLFLIAILFLLGLVLHLSVIVSRLEEQIRDLAEAYALALGERQDTSGQAQPPVGPPHDRQDQA